MKLDHLTELVRSTLGPRENRTENRKDHPTEKNYCINVIWDQKLCWKLTLEPKKTFHPMTGEAEPGVLQVGGESCRNIVSLRPATGVHPSIRRRAGSHCHPR